MIKDLIEIVLVPLILVFVLATSIVLLENHFMHKQCANNVTEMGREYKYDFVNGCRIGLDDGTFIYWKMYRELEL